MNQSSGSLQGLDQRQPSVHKYQPKTNNTETARSLFSPKLVVGIGAFLLFAPLALSQDLALIHLRDLPRLSVTLLRQYLEELACSGPVASSAPLSSLIRRKRGKRKDIPLSSTCISQCQ
jgi:hypothetical protein